MGMREGDTWGDHRGTEKERPRVTCQLDSGQPGTSLNLLNLSYLVSKVGAMTFIGQE